ncbi:endonuclease/exonuclease/phosphatase family protein [Streptomyces bluensis]|uniref:endonuclease/exonuclease/phosphatase family protein n=1 Tax=Streptomyces bluensis TaxID=33897 RepID=UPI0016785BCD|nr:endonuclease/exonuclease/phosphatase family protein [Streptomyces bluensis]GGZ40021.1 endonuclease [Streptomyces bluensis]
MKSSTRGALAAKAALALLMTAGLVTPVYAQGTGPGADPAPEPAAQAAVIKDRVMTWNSHGQDLFSGPGLLREQIRKFRPQIVLLQESCLGEVRQAVRQLKGYGLDYQYMPGMANYHLLCGGDNGQAVLVAKGTPLSNYKTVRYSKQDGEKRGYSKFTTKLAGRTVQVFNTHLNSASGAATRPEQITDLIAAARPYQRTLLGGDFNAQPWDGSMGPMWKERPAYRDVDPYCGKSWHRWCNGTQEGSGKKYDYLLHQGINSRACYLRNTRNEDHRVVVSDVTASAPSTDACRFV